MNISVENILFPQETSSDVFESLSKYIKQNYKCNLISWEPLKSMYPHNMFLGPDKGILAYVEFFYHSNPKNKNINGFAHEIKSLIKKISLVDSELDRPVFYIHILDSEDHQDIYFETTEQIKDVIFSGNYDITQNEGESYLCSQINCMGTFEELMTIFIDLKKNNVRYY